MNRAFEEWKNKNPNKCLIGVKNYPNKHFTGGLVDITSEAQSIFEAGQQSSEAELHKYKLALFAVVRNSTVMPSGIKLGKTRREINKMSIETVSEVMKSIDFDRMEIEYKDGER